MSNVFNQVTSFNDMYLETIESDDEAMQLALSLAYHAGAIGEVPVGAIVVLDGRVVGLGFNQPISSLDPSAHAEMIAIRDAAKRLGNYRINNAELFVTVEPCTMCIGLLLHSRIKRLVFGATEAKAGAVVSASQVPSQPWVNHSITVEGGVMAQECSAVMTQFFATRRERKKALKKRSNDIDGSL